MNYKTLILRGAATLMIFLLPVTTFAQKKDPSQGIREVLDRVFTYINGCTPAEVVDAKGRTVTDFSKIDADSDLRKGDFSIRSYEWGVTYSGLLKAAEVTGESKYTDYVYERLDLLGKLYPAVKGYYDETGYKMRLLPLTKPKWLDDCGSMDASMIKATMADPARSREFRALLDNWFDFVMYREYRLGDGILARNRPQKNSVWLDDMYMGITPIAWRGALSRMERGDLTQKFFNEAVNQVLLFKKYLWVPEKGIFKHGWIEGMSEHPSYHWARCNGWAMLTMCDVLDAIPGNTHGRDEVLALLKDQIRGVAALQAPDGRWHQLLDHGETYLETSATAMFVYCIAHAINEGWIDRTAYQDIARSGWDGLATQVNEKGQVENTCVGTGFGWTNTFYANRPATAAAAHGYGPVILAAAEMLRLYDHASKESLETEEQQFERMFAPQANAHRIKGKPMIFLAGDSTCKNGSGKGDGGQWGWGSFFGEYVTDKAVVDNVALGGRSSRTWFDQEWPSVRDQIEKGDYVLIQFGHNDQSPLGTGRARGTLEGISDEAQKVVMERNGMSEQIYSYGHYIRAMVRQAKMRGATPIILSPTPQNRWDENGRILRFTDKFNAWCRLIAAEEKVEFIDFNEIAADGYEKLGRETAQAEYFADGVHTFEKGARFYCETLAEAIKQAGGPLAKYVK